MSNSRAPVALLRPVPALVVIVVGGLLTGCDSDDAATGATDPTETTASPRTNTSTARTPASGPRSTVATADPVPSSTRAEEPAAPTAEEMLFTAQEFFAVMGRDDFAAAAELFVDTWIVESFGGGTLMGGDGDNLVDVLGFNGTILSFEPGACAVDETSRLPTVQCHDNLVHGPLPARLGIDQSFPLPLDLLFARDGRLVGVLPNRAALEQHPDAAATVAASSQIGVDLTGWIAETVDDSSTLLRPPGRAIIPTVENAERLVEQAQEFVTQTG